MKIIFDDFTLEDKIKGYTTVNVENNLLFVSKIKTLDIKGLDGSLIVDRKYPPREVIVHFLLKSDNANEFKKSLKKLNTILQEKNFYNFHIDDEEGYLRGTVTKIKAPPIDSFRGVGSFTLYCADPFYNKAYNVLNEVEEIKIPNDGVIGFMYIYTNVESFKKIKLVNETSGKKIIFNGDFRKEEGEANLVSVFFDMFKFGNKSIIENLDFFESDLEDFPKVSKDDVLKAYVYNENDEEFCQKIIMSMNERWI